MHRLEFSERCASRWRCNSHGNYAYVIGELDSCQSIMRSHLGCVAVTGGSVRAVKEM